MSDLIRYPKDRFSHDEAHKTEMYRTKAINEPYHDKSNEMACATSLDQNCSFALIG